MKKLLTSKFSRIVFTIIVYPLAAIIYGIGILLYYIGKPVKALSFLLIFKPYSALEEITDWGSPSFSLRDL